MVDGPLVIIYKMASLFLSSTLDTAVQMFDLFMQLITSLSYTISVAGPIGWVITFAILLPTVYLLSKFYGDTVKMAVLGVVLVIIVLIMATMFLG